MITTKKELKERLAAKDSFFYLGDPLAHALLPFVGVGKELQLPEDVESSKEATALAKREVQQSLKLDMKGYAKVMFEIGFLNFIRLLSDYDLMLRESNGSILTAKRLHKKK